MRIVNLISRRTNPQIATSCGMARFEIESDGYSAIQPKRKGGQLLANCEGSGPDLEIASALSL